MSFQISDRISNKYRPRYSCAPSEREMSPIDKLPLVSSKIFSPCIFRGVFCESFLASTQKDRPERLCLLDLVLPIAIQLGGHLLEKSIELPKKKID
jgi:hypothetical protein